MIHVSNLRPVKQVDAVVRVFARIRERVAARLLIVGEGPELGKAEQLINELGVADHVELIGETQDVVGLLSVSDLFLLPSLQESFGLVRARGDGVRRAGGGVERRRPAGSGDRRRDRIPASASATSEQMAESAITDPVGSRTARADWRPRDVRLAMERFSADRIVPQYAALYERARQHLRLRRSDACKNERQR